jgi:hypothetical protein
VRAGYIYGRTRKPTQSLLEERMASLEGGGAALAVASGIGAISSALWTLLSAGDDVVVDQTIYGSTFAFFTRGLTRFRRHGDARGPYPAVRSGGGADGADQGGLFRDPGQPPHHLDLLDRRARHHRVGDVVIVEVREDFLDVVDLEAATDALCGRARSHHEVLDEELAAAVEQLGQRHFARGPVEDIGFFNLHPRQRSALFRQPVAKPRELLLLGKQSLPRRGPIRVGDDRM